MKNALKDPVTADGKASTIEAGWPVDDINGLARRLPEIDPASYFDGQARDAYRQSLEKWPVLARMMNLAVRDGVMAVEAGVEPIKELTIG